MKLAFRYMRAALFAGMLASIGIGGAQAQQRMNGQGAYDAAGQRIAPDDGDAATRAAATRLEGAGGDPEALLGGPAPLADPYRSAYATAGHDTDALTQTERVPRGALAGGRYGPQPAMPGNVKGKGKARPGLAGNDDPGVDKADPGTRTPMGSALSIYHGPGDTAKAVGQVYKMPW